MRKPGRWGARKTGFSDLQEGGFGGIFLAVVAAEVLERELGFWRQRSIDIGKTRVPHCHFCQLFKIGSFLFIPWSLVKKLCSPALLSFVDCCDTVVGVCAMAGCLLSARRGGLLSLDDLRLNCLLTASGFLGGAGFAPRLQGFDVAVGQTSWSWTKR